MFFDRISKVIFVSLFETSHSSYARSSMVMASVSTFQAHNAMPAAGVAARRCFSCHTGIVTPVEDMVTCFGGLSDMSFARRQTAVG